MKTEFFNKQNIYFKSGFTEDYKNLYGTNAVKNYSANKDKFKKSQEEKFTDVQQVIYNSLESLALYGKYKAFKTLFKYIENEEELKSDAHLYNTAGNVYKQTQDCQKANELYKTAYNNVNTNDNKFFETERNYLESCLELNQNIDDEFKVLENRTDTNSALTYLALKSFEKIK